MAIDNYKSYTKDEYDIAVSVNTADYLRNNGYELLNEGNAYVRLKEHSSLVINVNNGKWKWNSNDVGGNNAVSLIKTLLMYDNGYDEKTAYIKAVKDIASNVGFNGSIVAGNKQYKPLTKPIEKTIETPKEKAELILPEKNENNKRVFAYLCGTRKLDSRIVSDLIKQGYIYETKQHHNVCFVSKDKDGVPRHAFLRGTLTEGKPFKSDVTNSDKACPFVIKGAENCKVVAIFESAIDAISHASLCKIKNADINVDRIVLNGISLIALESYLKDNPNIKRIVSCLDNDEAGHKTNVKLYEEYGENYDIKVFKPNGKDFNEDLISEFNKKNAYLNNQTHENIEIEIER